MAYHAPGAPEALADLRFLVDRLREPGWALIYSTVLDDLVLWYAVGRAQDVPRWASDGITCYREDELAILAAVRTTPDGLRQVHQAKQVFPRSRLCERPTLPIDWRGPHVGFVWDPAHGWPAERLPSGASADGPALDPFGAVIPAPTSGGPCPL